MGPQLGTGESFIGEESVESRGSHRPPVLAPGHADLEEASGLNPL